MIEIQWHPTRKDLRVFAGLLIVFGYVLAAIVRYRTGSTVLPVAIAGTGTLLGALGVIWPAGIRPIYLAWMIAAFPIGWTVSHLILATVYFLVFTPIGWLLRATGHDPMHRRLDRSLKNSYWELRTRIRKPSDYFRQF